MVFASIPFLASGIRFLLRRYLGEAPKEAGKEILLSTKLACAAAVLIWLIYIVVRVFVLSGEPGD